MEAGGTATVQSNWTATVVAVIATGTCLILAGTFAYLARRRARRLWWWFALALIAPTTTWLILTTTASIFTYTLP
jgi:ABC-type spermidine/putrescine transport system permease subunit I